MIFNPRQKGGNRLSRGGVMPDARCLSTTCLMLYALRAGLTRNHPVPERPLAARRAWTGLHGERRPKTARTTGAFQVVGSSEILLDSGVRPVPHTMVPQWGQAAFGLHLTPWGLFFFSGTISSDGLHCPLQTTER